MEVVRPNPKEGWRQRKLVAVGMEGMNGSEELVGEVVLIRLRCGDRGTGTSRLRADLGNWLEDGSCAAIKG